MYYTEELASTVRSWTGKPVADLPIEGTNPIPANGKFALVGDDPRRPRYYFLVVVKGGVVKEIC